MTLKRFSSIILAIGILGGLNWVHILVAKPGADPVPLAGKVSVTIASYRDRFVKGERVYVYSIVTNIGNAVTVVPSTGRPGALRYVLVSEEGDTVRNRAEAAAGDLISLPVRGRMEATEPIESIFANDSAAASSELLPGTYLLRAFLNDVSSNPLRIIIDPVPDPEAAIKSSFDQDIVLAEKGSATPDSLAQRCARLIRSFPSSRYMPIIYETFFREVERASVNSGWKFAGLETMVKTYMARYLDYPALVTVPATWSHILLLQNGWSRANLSPAQVLIMERSLNELFGPSRSLYIKQGLAAELARLREPSITIGSQK